MCRPSRRRLVGALHHRRELRPPDAGHHPRRAHRTRADAHLDDVGTGLDQLARALGRDDVAGDDLHVGQRGPDALDRTERAGLVPVGRVDDEDVCTEGDEILGPHRRIAVDPDRGADQQPPVGVDGRTVDGRAQRALAGDHADQTAVVVDDRGHTETLLAELLERRRGVDVGRQAVQGGGSSRCGAGRTDRRPRHPSR